jgi:hypothetical protein
VARPRPSSTWGTEREVAVRDSHPSTPIESPPDSLALPRLLSPLLKGEPWPPRALEIPILFLGIPSHFKEVRHERSAPAPG